MDWGSLIRIRCLGVTICYVGWCMMWVVCNVMESGGIILSCWFCIFNWDGWEDVEWKNLFIQISWLTTQKN